MLSLIRFPSKMKNSSHLSDLISIEGRFNSKILRKTFLGIFSSYKSICLVSSHSSIIISIKLEGVLIDFTYFDIASNVCNIDFLISLDGQ
jgi:hypothetical protein